MSKLIFFLPLALAAFPVSAAEPLSIESRVVVTADLDLASGAGQATLDRRIERAAAEVCGTAADVDLDGRNAVRACRVDTIARARDARDQRIASASGRPILLAAR